MGESRRLNGVGLIAIFDMSDYSADDSGRDFNLRFLI
jgi:hypothetical protein